ncbi:LysR substrate-binding domain-containing protein [Shimia sp.]|uniref:LysR substrate-binding domain-containing protein n=1 Tax=Shimia sp. TaxID=1954381 RepID=UPI003BA8BA1A
MSKSNKSPFRLDTDLLSLRTFIAVGDMRSFSAAAKQVGRTQSAVSLQISKLEQRLDAKLLARTSRKVELTQAGELFFNYAQKIIALADEAATSLSAPDTATPLRIGFAEYLAPDHLHDLLSRFKRSHPKLPIELKLGTGFDLRDQLDQNLLDVIITGHDGGSTKAPDSVVLREEPMVWVKGDCLDLETTEEVPLVVMHERCSYRKMATEILEISQRHWRIVTEANSIQGVQAAVKAGLGVSVVANSAATGLKVIEHGFPPLPRTAMVAYLPKTRHPLAERFVSFVAQGL